MAMVLGCYEPGGLSVSGESGETGGKGGGDYRFGITQGPDEPNNGQGRFIKSEERVVEVGNCRSRGLHQVKQLAEGEVLTESAGRGRTIIS